LFFYQATLHVFTQRAREKSMHVNHFFLIILYLLKYKITSYSKLIITKNHDENIKTNPRCKLKEILLLDENIKTNP